MFKRKDRQELSSGTDSIVNLKDFGLNVRQIDILTKITNDNMVLSYNDHQRLYDKSRATAERDFTILLENNLVKRIVKNRKVYYASIDY
ncbi:MAG: hypothetical protein IJ258_05880 [Methanobrevibacter sp.]|uniref:hypothetical protein n=1 Tax=Methanobrevibacter sp. TaxID=66852 RepID=UPI0025DD4F5F|nr:hypothetical protein [Methanobrevibacter sp.]MBQ8017621.1 hypothetical protein [Methanobrevibacter sp.]